MIRRIRRPLRVAVQGRDGVGRGAVAGALTRAGVSVTAAHDADVHIVVLAEAVKPEDRALLAAPARPVLAVLNKADLIGAKGADRRAADCRAVTAVPTVPMVALLAGAELDAELVAGLRLLAAEPADLTSTDAFVSAGHRLAPGVRVRMLATLDRFGIAQAVAALQRGVAADGLAAVLRRLSGVDEVLAHLDTIAAPLRYRRLCAALGELRSLAVQSGDERLADFLTADDTVVAVMAAAIDVVEAAGLVVDPGDDPSAHLRRAVHWRRYSRGPVSRLHSQCGADICRGSLRLLGKPR